VRGPEHVAADAPEAVDSGLQGHPMLLTVVAAAQALLACGIGPLPG
jgi:hypothetical protein